MKPKTKWVLALVGLVLAALIANSVYSRYFVPGQYDDFAKCLNEKGAVMYGAILTCRYTKGQAAMFGNSFKYVNYKEANELPGIKVTPTWVINGKWYEKVQSFDRLAELTGCTYR